MLSGSKACWTHFLWTTPNPGVESRLHSFFSQFFSFHHSLLDGLAVQNSRKSPSHTSQKHWPGGPRLLLEIKAQPVQLCRSHWNLCGPRQSKRHPSSKRRTPRPTAGSEHSSISLLKFATESVIVYTSYGLALNVSKKQRVESTQTSLHLSQDSPSFATTVA